MTNIRSIRECLRIYLQPKIKVQIYASVKNIYSRGVRFIQRARYRMVVVEISRRVVVSFISHRIHSIFENYFLFDIDTIL